MDLLLTRHGSIPGIGTFGQLKVGGHVYATVEREDLDNAPSVSCIPTGIYQLVPHQSSTKNKQLNGQCYAMVNEELGIYHYPDVKAKRYACLIHIANWPHELEGCIAPGLHYHPDKWGVASSTDAMREIIAQLGHDNHQLIITWRRQL